MKLYIINGKAGSGKDAFCRAVTELCGDRARINGSYEPIGDVIKAVHSSDPAKQALKLLGWGGNKTPEVRKLLTMMVNFGQQRGVTENLINTGETSTFVDVVFLHERNPKEIARIKTLWEDGKILKDICDTFKTILVTRDSKELEEDIWGIGGYDYDYTIDNCGTLNDLTEKAEQFIAKEGLYNV